jgi:hypothetical protein
MAKKEAKMLTSKLVIDTYDSPVLANTVSNWIGSSLGIFERKELKR